MTDPARLAAGLETLFDAIDRKDTERFLDFLTPTATFRFGAAAPVSGRKAIGSAVDAFFGTVAATQHQLSRIWHDEDTLVCRGEVTYTRLDGSQLTLPFVNVFELAGHAIERYEIYVDIGPLYAGG